MLEASSYSHTTYRSRYGQTGKMHILDNASFEEDTHCFIASWYLWRSVSNIL